MRINQTSPEVYAQIRETSDTNRAIGFVVTDMICCEGYIVHEYELTENPVRATLAKRREFKGKNNGGNYKDFQEFIEKQAGAEAVLFDPELRIIGNFSRSIEQALRNHIDMS